VYSTKGTGYKELLQVLNWFMVHHVSQLQYCK